jgi:hypothetical protein
MSATINSLPTSPNDPTQPAGADGGVMPPTMNVGNRVSEARPSPQDYGYRNSNGSRAAAGAKPAATQSLFLPMALASLALLGWIGFQSFQLFKERDALQAAYASQQQTVENAAKLRASLDALAADTQRMADGGNVNAKLLVDELRKRGITISTTANSTSPAIKP